MKLYRKPDGTQTGNKIECLREWETLTAGLEVALGVRVIAYDPGILISYKNGNGSIDMPVWLAQWIVNHAESPRRGANVVALADALGVPLDAVNANRIAQVKTLWNAQADAHNQWDSLSIDEMLEYALEQYALEQYDRMNATKTGPT